MRPWSIFLIFVFIFANAYTVAAQEVRLLKPEDYGQFETFGSAVAAPSGDWVAYQITTVDDSIDVRLYSVSGDTTHGIAWASNPAFSNNDAWFAWLQNVSKEEREALEKKDEPVNTDAGLIELATGVKRSFNKVDRFSFDATGRYLALMSSRADDQKTPGSVLRILELASEKMTTFGNVTEFSWSPLGSSLAFVVSRGPDIESAVQVFDGPHSTVNSLAASLHAFEGLTWREDSGDLALFRALPDSSEEKADRTVMLWRDADSAAPSLFQLDRKEAGLDSTLFISEHGSLRWADDGSWIALGLRPVETEEEEAEADSSNTETPVKDEDLPGLELWHSTDVHIVPEQKSSSSRDERRTLTAVWHVDSNRIVRVGSDLMAGATAYPAGSVGIERSDAAYPWGTKFGRRYLDLTRVDLETGERSTILEKVRYTWTSPEAKWLLFFDGADFWTIDLATEERHNISAGIPTVFADTLYDVPTDVTPPYLYGGWLAGDDAVFIYDRHDVWKVASDGSSFKRLTDGAPDTLEYRVAYLPGVQTTDEGYEGDIFLTVRGIHSKKTGYAILDENEEIHTVVFDDRRIFGLVKADSSDVLVYRSESFDDSPDLFITKNDYKTHKQVSHTNPFMENYAWADSELFDFTSETGRPLQAVLRYPAGYERGDKVPMIVYTYEQLSDRYHFFVVPDEHQYYNFTVWTQQGYAVLMPDIVYTAREPGMSALQAVRPAVQKAIDMGVADPERIGLIGHSWGGYQAAFIPTQTNLFAASVAGAPLTNFVSFMGQIHWSGGFPEINHWETGQGRMEVPFWEDPAAYARNSPIHHVQNLETPMLMVFGDEDGTVDYDQGTEFYNYARRAEKQMVLLVYQGEGHGYSKKPNRLDYHRRILEWFGHYLKGEPVPDWIEKGIPIKDQKAEARRVAEGKLSATPDDKQ